MKEVKFGNGIQDGELFHINHALDALGYNSSTFYRKGDGMLIDCPICRHPSSVLINKKKRINSVSCKNCHVAMKFNIRPSGHYTVRHAGGLERVNGENRTTIEGHIKN